MIYAIRATVSRAEGYARSIEWTWEGKGSATLCWNAWRKMKNNGLTIDTGEPFLHATLTRGTETVETQTTAAYAPGWRTIEA